jgi:hypothetical protein
MEVIKNYKTGASDRHKLSVVKFTATGRNVIDCNEMLLGLLKEISELQPQDDSAAAQVEYFQQIGFRWYEVACVMAVESVASDELVLRY